RRGPCEYRLSGSRGDGGSTLARAIHCHLPRARCFFFADAPPTETYTLSLHDALPISPPPLPRVAAVQAAPGASARTRAAECGTRSEEHTSELQSRENLVCRLLLEKKNSFALQRSGSSRSPADIEFSITTSPIFCTPPT